MSNDHHGGPPPPSYQQASYYVDPQNSNYGPSPPHPQGYPSTQQQAGVYTPDYKPDPYQQQQQQQSHSFYGAQLQQQPQPQVGYEQPTAGGYPHQQAPLQNYPPQGYYPPQQQPPTSPYDLHGQYQQGAANSYYGDADRGQTPNGGYNPGPHYQQPASHGEYYAHTPPASGSDADGALGPNGERGVGSTVMLGAAGAFVGSKLGIGKLGGAAAGAVLANVLGKKKK